MKRFIVIVITAICAVMTKGNYNPNFHEIEPTVQRNPNAGVASVSYELYNIVWSIDLVPAVDVESGTVYSIKDGLISTEKFGVRRYHYQGTVKGNPSSRVTFTICHGDQIHGTVFDGKDLYGLTYFGGKQYIERYPQSSSSLGRSIYGWENYAKKGSPVRIKMANVIEHSIFNELDGSFEKIAELCASNANIYNGMLSAFNIEIDLVQVVVWADKDYINMTSRSTKLLSRFERYISSQMPGRDMVDFVILYTMDLSSEGAAKLGSMGLRNGSGMIVRMDPHSVTINALNFLHEFFHMCAVKHDNGTSDFLMAERTSNHGNIMLSNESVEAFNEKMSETILDRLQQKGQQWTRIEGHSTEPSEEPKGWLVPDIVMILIGAILLLAVIYLIRKCRRSPGPPAEQSVAYSAIANLDLEAAESLASEPCVEAKPKKSMNDRSGTSLTDSGVTDNRSVEMETFPSTREPSLESFTSGHSSPSQASVTSEAD